MGFDLDKDIFTELLEREMQSENASELLAKFGPGFIEKLKVIGPQLEQLLLSCDIKVLEMDRPILAIAEKEWYSRARKGLEVLKLVESEVYKVKSEPCPIVSKEHLDKMDSLNRYEKPEKEDKFKLL